MEDDTLVFKDVFFFFKEVSFCFIRQNLKKKKNRAAAKAQNSRKHTKREINPPRGQSDGGANRCVMPPHEM